MKNYLTPKKFLTDEETASLTTILDRWSNRDTILIRLALETGARASELLNLKVEDVEHSSQSIFIRSLKGGNNRQVPLTPKAYASLTALINGADPHLRIFPIKYRRLCDIWHYYRPFKKPFHSLRHSRAISAYKKTRNIKAVQNLLGHRSITTTQIYTDFVYSVEELRAMLT